MATALEFGYDLGALAACYVAIALLLLVVALVDGVAHLFDFSLFGYRPLHGIAAALKNGVVGALDDAIKGLEGATAHFESGLIDALGIVLAIPLLLAFGVKAAFQYLWHHALVPLIHSITDTIKSTAEQALSGTIDATGAVTGAVAKAETYARDHATAALTSAEGYVDDAIKDAKKVLRGDIAAAKSAAEGYADTAVAGLKSLEDTAIAGAVSLAGQAKTAGLTAAAAALSTAEGEITAVKHEALAAAAGALSTAEGEITLAKAAAVAAAAGALTTAEAEIIAARNEAETVASVALGASEAVGAIALEGVRSIAIDLRDDLHTIEGTFTAAGLAALIASIPAIGLLVNTIATEAGLEKAECRAKVKGVCTTDPTLWGDLLSGLSILGFAFSLRELAIVAEPLVAELGPLIAKAA